MLLSVKVFVRFDCKNVYAFGTYFADKTRYSDNLLQKHNIKIKGNEIFRTKMGERKNVQSRIKLYKNLN